MPSRIQSTGRNYERVASKGNLSFGRKLVTLRFVLHNQSLYLCLTMIFVAGEQCPKETRSCDSKDECFHFIGKGSV